MMLRFCILFLFITSSVYSQKILLVDDDTYSKPDHYPRIKNAVALAIGMMPNYTFEEYIAGVDAKLDIEKARQYSSIIWYCGNTGVGTELWNGNKTDNTLLPQLLAEGKNVWIIGNDFLLDRYGNAPKDFAAGDFAYDVLGMSKLVGESKKDDNDMGLPYVVATQKLGLSVDTLRWSGGNLWYADACSLREGVVPVYTMAPQDYVFANYSCMWMNKAEGKGTVLSTTFDPWFIEDIETLNMFFYIVIKSTDMVSSLEESANDTQVTFFPNPVSDRLVFSGMKPDNLTLSVHDMMGNQYIKTVNEYGNGQWSFDVKSLHNGIYTATSKNGTFTFIVNR